MSTANVICMKWGTKYGPEYVNTLYSMVKRHMKRPFRFVCLTDDDKGLSEGIDAFPIPKLDIPNGPERGLAHVYIEWDSALHDQVGGNLCGNGSTVDCPKVGLLRHKGSKFADGLPVTPNGDCVGPAGGFGTGFGEVAGAGAACGAG